MTLTRHRGVIGNHCEFMLSLPHNLFDDPFGAADGHEPTDKQAFAVIDLRNSLFHRNRLHSFAPMQLLPLLPRLRQVAAYAASCERLPCQAEPRSVVVLSAVAG